MKTIKIYKAQSAYKGDEKEDLTIVFDKSFPEMDGMPEHNGLMRVQALELHEALRRTLPGGIYDRLFALMAQRKASDFSYAHEE